MPPLTDSRTFTVTVAEINHAPVLAAVAAQTIDEGNALSLNLSATDVDLPADSLTYTLVSGPSGMSVGLMNGLVTWMPSESQGPSTNTVTVKVTDSGLPPASDTKSFTIVVNEVNTAPVLAAIGDKTVRRSSSLSFALAANDADVPANALTYSLVTGPVGASVDADGTFRWTPSGAESLMTNLVTVRVSDDGAPPLSDTRSFQVVVTSSNSAPVLELIPNQFVNEGALLSVPLSATDTDGPASSLRYTLLSGPSGMTVTGGSITWTPSETQGPGTKPGRSAGHRPRHTALKRLSHVHGRGQRAESRAQLGDSAKRRLERGLRLELQLECERL